MISVLSFLLYFISFLFIFSLQLVGLTYAIASLFYKNPPLRKILDKPKVAIVVACRNEREVVLKTINHLLHNLSYSNKEIIIGDDSNNDTYQLILKSFNLIPQLYKETELDGKIYIAKNKFLTVIHRDRNYDFKAGNLSICHDYIKENNIPFYTIFDADWLPDSNFIEKILPFFYTYSRAGCVQFKRLLPQRTSSFFSRITSRSPETAYQVDLPGRAKLKTFVLFCGSAGMFRTEAVTNSGGWKSGDLTEDIDLSMRLYLRGYKIYFDTKSKSYGQETPDHFSDFMKQQSRWQRGTMDSAKKYFMPALTSKYLSLNEKIGVIYQLFIFFPYLLVLLFILFNITVDILVFLGILPASLYILFGTMGQYFYWVAFFIFFFDMFKISLSILQGQHKRRDIFLVPLITLMYWALIPSGFLANLKSLFNIKENWFLTPKSKSKSNSVRNHSYRLYYLVLFIAVYFTYVYEFLIGYSLNWYHFFLPTSLFLGVLLE